MLKFGCNQNFCHNSIFLSLNTTRIKINYVPKWEKVAQIFNAYLFKYMYITTYLTNPVVCYRIWRNWIILSIETCFLWTESSSCISNYHAIFFLHRGCRLTMLWDTKPGYQSHDLADTSSLNIRSRLAGKTEPKPRLC